MCHYFTLCNCLGEIGGGGEMHLVNYSVATTVNPCRPCNHLCSEHVLAFPVSLSRPLSSSQLSSPPPSSSSSFCFSCPVTTSLTFFSCLVLFNPFPPCPGLFSLASAPKMAKPLDQRPLHKIGFRWKFYFHTLLYLVYGCTTINVRWRNFL